jgi:hypothetical protein
MCCQQLQRNWTGDADAAVPSRSVAQHVQRRLPPARITQSMARLARIYVLTRFDVTRSPSTAGV